MCGIVGIWSFKKQIDQGVLTSMRDTLTHRGPDDAGIYLDEENGLGLGHRRLSILDLSPLVHRPVSNEEKSMDYV